MPIYRNPDFRRLPSGLATIFETSGDSFFALPGWYDLMARHGAPGGAEIRVYSDERPGSATALVMRTDDGERCRSLQSLANAYSVEHGIVAAPGTDLGRGLDAILAEIVAERPQFDRLSLAELDPREIGFDAAVAALRRTGFLIEQVFHSGTWYEETTGMSFAEYVAARPSELRHTWQRKRRRAERDGRLKKIFIADCAGIDAAIADYEAIYAASWKPAEAFPEFIPALMRLAAGLGALRLGVYHIDGIPAAAQFWLLWRGRAVIYKLAHDKRFDELSLGTLLTMEMTERVLTLDRPYEINLGRGDDPYKKLWLPKRRERWGIIAANPRTRRGLVFGLGRQAAKIYHRLRGEPIAPTA